MFVFSIFALAQSPARYRQRGTSKSMSELCIAAVHSMESIRIAIVHNTDRFLLAVAGAIGSD